MPIPCCTPPGEEHDPTNCPTCLTIGVWSTYTYDCQIAFVRVSSGSTAIDGQYLMTTSNGNNWSQVATSNMEGGAVSLTCSGTGDSRTIETFSATGPGVTYSYTCLGDDTYDSYLSTTPEVECGIVFSVGVNFVGYMAPVVDPMGDLLLGADGLTDDVFPNCTCCECSTTPDIMNYISAPARWPDIGQGPAQYMYGAGFIIGDLYHNFIDSSAALYYEYQRGTGNCDGCAILSGQCGGCTANKWLAFHAYPTLVGTEIVAAVDIAFASGACGPRIVASLRPPDMTTGGFSLPDGTWTFQSKGPVDCGEMPSITMSTA